MIHSFRGLARALSSGVFPSSPSGDLPVAMAPPTTMGVAVSGCVIPLSITPPTLSSSLPGAAVVVPMGPPAPMEPPLPPPPLKEAPKAPSISVACAEKDVPQRYCQSGSGAFRHCWTLPRLARGLAYCATPPATAGYQCGPAALECPRSPRVSLAAPSSSL